MLKFNEELLQFIWRYKLLKPLPFITLSGNTISVLNPGEQNLDAGPDFFNAQIRINEILLAGNIELHIKTSDWLKHKHQQDKSYNTIILHVVYIHDIELDQNIQYNVEVLELKNLIDAGILEAYRALASNKAKLPCASQLSKVEDVKFISWMEKMTIERLEEKVKRIEEWFLSYSGDYSQTFYTCLLRSFGFKVNAVPFELMAKQLPVQIVLKHADNLFQLEALLLGISGLLNDQFKDSYILSLKNEFEFLKQKYQLRPLQKELFKFSKLRPANFPALRLAQLANLIHTNKEIFASSQNKQSYHEIRKILKTEPIGYWKDHYTSDGNKSDRALLFGPGSIEHIMINAFVPFFFFYSKKLSKPDYGVAAIELLNACKMESNTKTKLFAHRKGNLKNAAASQGIINLYDKFCVSKKCLKCGIAAAILNPA